MSVGADSVDGRSLDASMINDDVYDGGSVKEAVERSSPSTYRRSPQPRAAPIRSSRKLKGEHLSVGHVDIQNQQNIVSAIKEGAFYKEKQRDAWIGGMVVAFVLFVGFAIGGFFFYKSKIGNVIDESTMNISDDEKKRLKSDIGTFDAVQMLWYLGWGLFSFLVGYIIYFVVVKNWRRRQMIVSKQLAQSEQSYLASQGKFRPTGGGGTGGPIGITDNFREGSQSIDTN